ncbi:MAG: SipW-dependent-type signal peptide-containing protein [Bacillota bacterium]
MIRSLKLLLLVSIMAFFVTHGSFGYFTAQATSPRNSITAGTLYLGKDETNKGILDGSLKLEKMIPGESPREFRLTIKNVGNLNAYINGLSASIKESDSKFMANAIRVTCAGPGGEKLYSGSLLSLDGNAVPTENEVVIEPGDTKILTFTFQLDHRAGNWYKGKNIETSLIVHAGQSPGLKPDSNVVVTAVDLQGAVHQVKPGGVILVPAGEYGKLEVNRSDVTIKSKDVVYDTLLAGISFTGQAQNVAVQGFTIDGRDNLYNPLSIADSSTGITITDNIFLNDKRDGKSVPKFIIVGKSTGISIQRNDFSAMAGGKWKPRVISADGSQTIRYNLGLDLDPSVEAL